MSLQGFDKNYYLDAKLSALQATNPEWVGKTTSDLDAALQSAGLTAEQHYSTYGWKEGLEPNKFFSPEEYVAAKAAQMVSQGLYATASAATAAFNAGWTDNPYNHYLLYGGNEKLNPSNAFDESTYLTDLLTAAKASGATPQTTTLDDVRAYFAANGLTALGHYIDYGKAEGLHVTVVPAGEQVHAYDQQGFVLTAGAASYNEGSTAMFKLATTNVSDGTVLTYNLSGTGISTSDVTSGSLTGTVTVVNNAADISIGLRSDYTTEGSETLKVAIAGTNASAQSTVYDTSTGGNGGDTPPVVPPVNPPNTPTYTLTAGAASYSEGSTAVFNLVTTNVANGTVLNYTLAGSGITAADVTGGSLSGTVTVNNNAAVINVALANDVTTEGSETLVATVSGTSASTVITDTSTAVSGITVDVNAANTTPYDAAPTNVAFNVAAGNYTYNIAGFAAGDRIGFPVDNAPTVVNSSYTDNAVDLQWAFNGQVVTMHLTGISNANDAVLNSVADFNTLFGSGTIGSGSVTPPVPATYALTAAATNYNEGATAVFNLVTTNVADGTIINYALAGTGITAADITGGSLTGTATVNGNAAVINVGLASDHATEGAETLAVSITGTTATANTLINDTSVAGPAVTVPVTAGNTTPYDASASDVTFNIASGNYTYNISGFAAGDKMVFPAATNVPTVINNSYTDGAVDLQWAYSGQVITVHLTGVSNANDVMLNSIADFNTVFGAGTVAQTAILLPQC